MAACILYLLLSALLVVTAKASVIKQDTSSSPQEGSTRIIDGYPAGVGQFPYHAFVLLEDTYICSGSLITRSAVLSSAYCTNQRKKFGVRLGGIHRTEDESTAWIVETTWATEHPDYGATYHTNNVAVIFLPEEAPLNSFINVVTLPSSLDADNTFAGKRAVITGWGQPSQSEDYSETLQWTEVSVIPNSVCTESYASGFVTETVMCAGNENVGKCWGDDGGPLVIKTESGYKQIGVASPTSDCSAEVPGLYARVTPVLDWIITTAGMSVQ